MSHITKLGAGASLLAAALISVASIQPVPMAVSYAAGVAAVLGVAGLAFSGADRLTRHLPPHPRTAVGCALAAGAVVGAERFLTTVTPLDGFASGLSTAAIAMYAGIIVLFVITAARATTALLRDLFAVRPHESPAGSASSGGIRPER